jgi:hypothetical protein
VAYWTLVQWDLYWNLSRRKTERKLWVLCFLAHPQNPRRGPPGTSGARVYAPACRSGCQFRELQLVPKSNLGNDFEHKLLTSLDIK